MAPPRKKLRRSQRILNLSNRSGPEGELDRNINDLEKTPPKLANESESEIENDNSEGSCTSRQRDLHINAGIIVCGPRY